MNVLIEQNYISEMEVGSNFSYILNDNKYFLSTEYKVLQSQVNSCFVKCMKMLYNGKVQLYYLTNIQKPFSTLIQSLDADNFLTIVANLLADIIEVKHNGFLSCQNIDISFNKIFVDPSTYKVSLVYLPLNKRMYPDMASFENELRTELIKVISKNQNLASSRTLSFSADLSNGILTIEDLYSHIKKGGGAEPIRQTPIIEKSKLMIVALNAPTKVQFEIDKNEFVIGKKPGLCDGIISFNKMISRSHCKICRKGSQFMIIDLQSSNGTYVNKVRLQPNTPHLLKDKDVIRLANSDFQVIIK